jgi:hypothetical protein
MVYTENIPVLNDLPSAIRNLFLLTKDNIANYGNCIIATTFSLISSQILFRFDNEDGIKVENKEISRNVIYQFYQDEDFVDRKISDIDENMSIYQEFLIDQGIIYLWSAIETFLKSLFSRMIITYPDILKSEKFQKITFPQLDDMSMQEDLAIDITNLIFKKIKYQDCFGVERIEAYLAAIGLDGKVNEEIKDTIQELNHVRNCIAHNNGFVDQKLVMYCGNNVYKIGERLNISLTEYSKFENAIMIYIQEIFIRVNQFLGAPQNTQIHLRKMCDDLLSGWLNKYSRV